MLNVQRSESSKNPKLRLAPRQSSEANAAWLARQASAEAVHLLLVGGTSTWDFRLRVAQSHLRDDLTPSHWSHVALLGPLASQVTRTPLFEIPLIPRRDFAALPESNGVLKSTLQDYDAPQDYPNIAIIEVPLGWKALTDKVEQFKRARTTIDALELHLAWLAFAWGVGRLANPLYDEVGFPSAALLEYVASALDYDLTPAFPSRSSCPEAIWQAASYWYELAQRDTTAAPGTKKHRVTGAYVVDDRIGKPNATPGASGLKPTTRRKAKR